MALDDDFVGHLADLLGQYGKDFLAVLGGMRTSGFKKEITLFSLTEFNSQPLSGYCHDHVLFDLLKRSSLLDSLLQFLF